MYNDQNKDMTVAILSKNHLLRVSRQEAHYENPSAGEVYTNM